MISCIGSQIPENPAEQIAEQMISWFPNRETTEIPPSIPEYFPPSKGPKKPVIAIHTRDHRDTQKIIKEFCALQNVRV